MRDQPHAGIDRLSSNALCGAARRGHRQAAGQL